MVLRLFVACPVHLVLTRTEARASVGTPPLTVPLLSVQRVLPMRGNCGLGSLENRDLNPGLGEDTLRHAPNSLWMHTGGAVGWTQ